ncbi:MAG TPA: biopolymer transporter ExbD [Thermodesulfobacteriota bacterium]|nr:biopolymer transporter ExbD [Thermodesulfobacteriota bacterium]
MAKRRQSSHDVIADINITPFTDVVLVLLIIFMIATPLLIQAGIKVDLPVTKKQTNTAQKQEVFITISISADGSISLDGQKYPIDNIEPILQQLMKINPNSIVAIGGEPKASYDTVVQVLDIARAAGVTKYVLVK